MENSKPQEDRTKIISQEEFWDMTKEQRDIFNGFYINKVSIEYGQKVHNDFQTLTISTNDSGGGRYFNLETEKFSLNDKEELEDILKDFLIRAEMK
jgi:hypothetical protein